MKKIRLLRAQQGITQEQLCQQSGISRQTIHDLETNGITERTRPVTLYKLARALDVSVEELANGTTPSVGV
jgi:transcriptional regulator with XRE-family HTH domain